MAGTNRMNREQFAAATAGLGEAELRKALWTVYWRGTAAVRERIEEILSPDTAGAVRRSPPQAPDPDDVLAAVQEFTGLVRSGAYIAGNRAVRPKERSQWRFTFRRLLADSRAALAAPDPAGGEAALTEMIDLACQLRDYEYVRSEDPIEAAAVVVSDEIAVLWRHLLDQHGFAGFAAQAAEQFLRWESRYGWTRTGWGTISERERRLTDVLTGLLTVPDTWVTFTEHYLQVLDGLAPPPPPPASARGRGRSYQAEQQRRDLERGVARRAQTMIDWHLVLLDRFVGTEDEALVDRLADHAALGGPEQTYFLARLAQERGDLPAARRLIHQALEQLPGHSGFLALARETDAPLPPNARIVAASRRLPDS
ncbi:MAG: hypothetical protein WAL50_10350 [Kineosporiaceae bacterium]